MFQNFEALRGMPVAVACQMSDEHSRGVAMDVVQLLRAAGCLVPAVVDGPLKGVSDYVTLVARGEVPARIMRTLEAAFTAAQVSVRVEDERVGWVGLWYPNTVHIIIGC